MANEPVWNLKDLLPEHKGPAFDKLLTDLNEKVAAFEQKRSLLVDNISAEQFNGVLHELEEIDATLSTINAYGELWFSEDTSNDDARAYNAKIDVLSTDISNKTMFFELWWKLVDDSVAERLIKTAGKNHYFLEHMRKLREHALPEREEKIINLKDISGVQALNNVYDTFTSAFEFPLKIDGQRKKVMQSELLVQVRGPDPKLREDAYKSLFKVYKKHRAVLGEIYCSIVRDWNNESLKLRKYRSPIGVRNSGNDLPDEAIDALIATCRENRFLFHEYFRLKANLMGMEKMNRYHIYAPLEKDQSKIPFGAAVKTVLETFAAFSPRIAALAKNVFDKQHVHAPVQKNKRSGAFCYGITPKTTPYVLLNYTETFDDVITMAHELGHAVHDQLVEDKTMFTFQPPLPLAETASVFGELMVTHKLLEQEKNPKLKKHLIAQKLDDIYATIMRQTYFIVFEQRAHEIIPQGATLKELSKEYYENLKEQFGDIAVPKEFSQEWMYIPHIFHTPFYCYAYSFGNLLTLALYQMYREEGASFIPKYLKLLSYGGSENPEKVLQELNINIRSKEFWQKGFAVVKEMLDEFKQLN